MRTFIPILIASVLGLSSTAFAATPSNPTTRDARMADAMKNYQAQKSGAPATAKAAAPATTKRLAAKRHVAKKHAAKKVHARSHKAHGATVKAAPATTK